MKFVISDSGGIQEECASFKEKILVCRDNTEGQEVSVQDLLKLLVLKWKKILIGLIKIIDGMDKIHMVMVMLQKRLLNR